MGFALMTPWKRSLKPNPSAPNSPAWGPKTPRWWRVAAAATARHGRRWSSAISAWSMRLGLDEHSAADVFQTVFARLVQHLPRIVDPERLQGWIAVTAKREALLQLRRSRRTVSMSRDDDDDEGADWDFADGAPQPGDALDLLQQLDRLRHGLDRLDERSRKLLLLLFRADDEKVPYDEVARQMGMSIGSIGPTRARCLAKLRRLMA
jgi:RNA polymerase sigma factor (sigma-70 family)